MKSDQKQNLVWIICPVLVLFVIGCSLLSTSATTPAPASPVEPTSTPTPASGTMPEANACEGLQGELEMQVLVGPAEAAGLEPFAVGTIPFSVVKKDGEYHLQGGGDLSYQEVLEKEWGTYTVSLEMDTTIDGICTPETDGGELAMSIEMMGEQMLEVRAEGFQGEYPWSGSYQKEFVFPLEEGATVEGEGWAFILRLNP